MNRIFFFILLGAALVPFSLFGATYLAYEPGENVDKFEYQVIFHTEGESQAPSTVLAFHYRINAAEEVTLRTVKVGDFDTKEYQLTEQLVPSQQVGAVADKSWIEAVDATDFNIYIVEAGAGFYTVYRVTDVAFYTFSRYSFEVSSQDYNFDYQYFETYNPSEALSQNDETGAMVLFAGKSKTDCYEQVGMLAIPSHVCSTAINIEVLKGIGLRTERRGDYTLELQSINGESLPAYLMGEMCQKSRFEQPFTYQQLLAMGNTARGGGQDEAFADVKVVDEKAQSRHATREVQLMFDRNQVNIKSGGAPTARGLSANAAAAAPRNDTAKYVIVYPYVAAGQMARGGDMQHKGLTFKGKGATQNENAAKWIVKKGETLYSIAKSLNVTVEDLKAWNQLPDNTINTGQELRTKPQ